MIEIVSKIDLTLLFVQVILFSEAPEWLAITKVESTLTKVQIHLDEKMYLSLKG